LPRLSAAVCHSGAQSGSFQRGVGLGQPTAQPGLAEPVRAVQRVDDRLLDAQLFARQVMLGVGGGDLGGDLGEGVVEVHPRPGDGVPAGERPRQPGDLPVAELGQAEPGHPEQVEGDLVAGLHPVGGERVEAAEPPNRELTDLSGQPVVVPEPFRPRLQRPARPPLRRLIVEQLLQPAVGAGVQHGQRSVHAALARPRG